MSLYGHGRRERPARYSATEVWSKWDAMANRVMLRFVMREVPRRGERLGAEILADLIRVKNAAARRAQESESGGSPPDRTRYVHEVHEALAAELDRAETGQADVPQESTRDPGSDDDFGEWP